MSINMDIDKEIQLLQKRNKSVEQKKRWETSLTRRILIVIVTYLFALGFLIIIKY